MGVRSWFRVPALPRSRCFRNAGTRERKFYTGARECRRQKNRIAKFAFLWIDDTVMTCTESRGGRGYCGRDTSLTPNRLPTSILVHRARVTVHAWWGGGGSGAVASWPSPPDPSIHTPRACDELLPHPTHICSLTQEHRNMKQERGNAKVQGTHTHLCQTDAMTFAFASVSILLLWFKLTSSPLFLPWLRGPCPL